MTYFCFLGNYRSYLISFIKLYYEETKLNIFIRDLMNQITDRYKIVKKYVTGNKNWSNTTITNVDLKGVILKEINLTNSCLISVNLDSCNLEQATLSAAHLRNCNLANSRLKQANLAKANLKETNFYKAHLEKTNFRQANLKNADFRDAYLYRADLRGACLQGARLEGACLVGALYDTETVFDSNFSVTKTEMICYEPFKLNKSIFESSDTFGYPNNRVDDNDIAQQIANYKSRSQTNKIAVVKQNFQKILTKYCN